MSTPIIPRHHHEALLAFDRVLAAHATRPAAWSIPRRSGAWTPQDETAHVLRSCAYAIDVLAGGETMPVERPAWVTGPLRTVVLPVLLALGTFPRGGRAPALLAPTHPLTVAHRHPSADAARAALARLGGDVAVAFAAAMRAGGPRVPHAYFGAMPPGLAWRVLSAHTAHHARLLTDPR